MLALVTFFITPILALVFFIVSSVINQYFLLTTFTRHWSNADQYIIHISPCEPMNLLMTYVFNNIISTLILLINIVHIIAAFCYLCIVQVMWWHPLYNSPITSQLSIRQINNFNLWCKIWLILITFFHHIDTEEIEFAYGNPTLMNSVPPITLKAE